MSGLGKPVPRRPLLYAIAASLGLAVAGGVAIEFLQPYRRTISGPYGDLISQLPDPAAAATLGKAMFAADPNTPLPNAPVLRKELGAASLAAILADDLFHKRLAEAAHWVVPETLADLAILAARNG